MYNLWLDSIEPSPVLASTFIVNINRLYKHCKVLFTEHSAPFLRRWKKKSYPAIDQTPKSNPDYCAADLFELQSPAAIGEAQDQVENYTYCYLKPL